jgi:hypothetical protein
VDLEGVEVGGEGRLGPVTVDRDRRCDRPGPVHGVVDEGHPAHRAQGFGPEEGEGPEALAGTRRQHDRGRRVASCQTVAMQQRRWLNPAQPQTLQIAVFLFYANSFFIILALLLNADLPLIYIGIFVGQVAAGWGIANEMKWAYYLGLAMAVLPFAIRFYYFSNPFSGTGLISLMFEIALIALLVHPQSRDYQRIWFK